MSKVQVLEHDAPSTDLALRTAKHPDFPDYLIRADGQVTSLRQKPPRPLSPVAVGKYWGLQLTDRTGAMRRIYLHRLVAETFHGPCPPGQEARHKDGDPSHNAEDNLTWGTRSQNMRDKERHGTAPLGMKHPMAKLTDAEVLEMRRLHKAGATLPDLEARFASVSRMTIYRAATGRSWQHLEQEYRA